MQFRLCLHKPNHRGLIKFDKKIESSRHTSLSFNFTSQRGGQASEK